MPFHASSEIEKWPEFATQLSRTTIFIPDALARSIALSKLLMSTPLSMMYPVDAAAELFSQVPLTVRGDGS